MSEYGDFDLDRSVGRAWSTFQARLADVLLAMTDEDSLVVEVLAAEEPDDGATPYVQFAGFGGDHLRGEVSGNRYLAADHQLDAAREGALLNQGWQPPDDGNFFVHVPTAQADRLAVMAVRALRDVLDVPHPAFLTTGSQAEAAALGLSPAPVDLESSSAEGDEPLAVIPESLEHLHELVDQALVQVFGHVPLKDDDGDIPVPNNTALVFIRVSQDQPVVELFANVVHDVQDLEAARVEVGILNRDYRFIKFVALDDQVLAQIQIPSYPFVPKVLRAMLALMCTALDEIDDDLAVRTGGRRALEPPTEPAESPGPAPSVELHPALRTLMQLDADGTTELDPYLVADVCERDRDLILKLLHDSSLKEITWRQAQEEALLQGDDEEEAACARELAAWERTTAVLRRALRLVARARGEG